MKIEFLGWTLTIEKTFTTEKEVEHYREQYENGEITKVQAVKNVRMVFLGTLDYRGTLKGARTYIDRS